MAGSSSHDGHSGLEEPGSLDSLKFPAITVEPSSPALEPVSKQPVDQALIDETGQDTIPPKKTPTTQKESIVVSPYTTPAHLLDLSTVSRPNQLLAKALSLMQPTRDDYATAPYKQSFNWSAVIYRLRHLLKHETDFQWTRQEKFYVIVFRSRLPLSTDRVHLGALDQVAHAEATASGGLLKYWFGVPDADGRNLATCKRPSAHRNRELTGVGIWRAPGDAKRGGTGPGHRQAMRETRALYLEWKIEQLALVIGPDAFTWGIVDWAGVNQKGEPM